jgi:MFS family permease
MATPSREERRYREADRSASQNSDGRSTQHLPFRPIGAPLRCPAESVQREVLLPTENLRRRLGHFVQVVFINQNFALLWWGQAISSVGDYAWDTALVLWIATYLAAGQSWAPLAVSGVVLAAALPQVVVGPIAGVFVDRWDKRQTMVVMAALQAIVATLLVLPALNISFPYLGSAQSESMWRIVAVYIDVIVLSSFAQFFTPAQFALIKDIVPDEQQDKALETSQAIQGLAVILGPPIAAALVFGLGVGWALVLNAASFVIVLLAVLAIKSPPSAHSLAPGEAGHFSREFLDGLGYVIQHRVLRTILVAEVLTWLGFGALESLGYFFITENLHAPASDYGLLGADFGVGAIAGALLVRLIGQRIGLERLLWIALITSGLFVIVMSHLTSLYPALAAAFFFGVSTTAIIVTAGPLALHGTSREYVGRVMAVINPLGRLAALLSVVLAGYLVSTVLHGFHASLLGISFRPVDTVFSGMGLLAVIGGIYARISLREIVATSTASSSKSS